MRTTVINGSPWKLAGWGALAILSTAVAAFARRARRRTSDAHVGARTIEVGAEVAGEVAAVYVQEGHVVHAGDPLADLVIHPYQSALEQARVQLAERRAELQDARRHKTRMQRLAHRGSISVQGAELALTRAQAAEVALREAEAVVTQAALDVLGTHIIAPADGIVANVTMRPGAAVQPRAPLVVLVSDS